MELLELGGVDGIEVGVVNWAPELLFALNFGFLCPLSISSDSRGFRFIGDCKSSDSIYQIQIKNILLWFI